MKLTKRPASFLASAAMISTAPAMAADDDRQLQYFLPKTSVSAQLKQTITQCAVDPETGAVTVNVVSEVGLKSGASPDYRRLVTLNGKSGFLVDRSTEIKLNADGTLKEFNATATGQGATVLAAVIKAGAFVATSGASGLALGMDPQPVVHCKTEITKAIAKLGKKKQRFHDVRMQIVGGNQSQGTLDEIERLTKEIAILTGKLTIKKGISLTPKWVGNGVAGLVAGPKDSDGKIIRAKYENWFKISSGEFNDGLAQITLKSDGRSGLPGIHGIKLTIVPSEPAMALFSCERSGASNACNTATGITSRHLKYTRPIPAKVKLTTCADTGCSKAHKIAGTSGTHKTSFAQLSDVFTLSTGGSIFGQRTVAATFGANGEPLSLKYSKGGSGADIASVINAGTDAATKIDGAKLTAIQDEIALIKAEQELDELLDEEIAENP